VSKQIGTVQILRTRIYTIDPEQDVTDILATSAVVEPGEYPVYRDRGATYWMLTGRVNKRGFERLGDGLFAIQPGDEAGDEEVRFPSKRFGPSEFADLLAKPECVEGPARRLVFTLDGAS
jgi:hypothetical protein